MAKMLGDFQAEELMAEGKELMEQLQKLGFNRPRPWKEFFAVLKPPKQWQKKEIEERLTTNLLHYRSNYAVLLALVLSYSIFTSLFTLSILLVCIGSFVVMFGWKKPIEIMGRVLTRRDKALIASAFSLLIMLLTGTLVKLLLSCSVGLLLVMTHMIFRPRSLGSKMNKFSDEIKLNSNNLSPEEDLESPSEPEANQPMLPDPSLRPRAKLTGVST